MKNKKNNQLASPFPLREESPHFLINLWDMNQIIASHFLATWQLFNRAFQMAIDNRTRQATKEEAESLIKALTEIHYQCGQLGLRQSVRQCDRLLDQLKDPSAHRVWKMATPMTMTCTTPKQPFILAQNVRPMRLDLSERQAVAAPEDDAETERTRVRVDDLLVTIVGAKTGDVCRVPAELEDHFVCQSVALLRPVESASAKFTEFYLASQENGQAQWKHYVYGQGRPHLSFEQLRMTAVALPPLVEQTRIQEPWSKSS